MVTPPDVLEVTHFVFDQIVADRAAWADYRRVTRRRLQLEAARHGCAVRSGTARGHREPFMAWTGRGLAVRWRARLRPLTDAEKAAIESGPDMSLRMALWSSVPEEHRYWRRADAR